MPFLKTLAELKGYVATDMDKIQPAITLELTVAAIISALLGPELVAWLQAAYDDPAFEPAGPTASGC